MKLLLVFALWAFPVVSTFAYQAQFGVGTFGAAQVEAIGKFRFSNFGTFDLAPTNAPSANAVYSVRCQVIFTDSDGDRPLTTDLQRQAYQLRGMLLMDHLRDFIAEKYAGADYADLLWKFYVGAVGIDINQLFPAYVKEKMADVDLDIVQVQVFPAGDFFEDLRKLQD